MDILIFRPKNVYNSVSSVVVYPGLNYFRNPPDIDEIDPGEYGLGRFSWSCESEVY